MHTTNNKHSGNNGRRLKIVFLSGVLCSTSSNNTKLLENKATLPHSVCVHNLYWLRVKGEQRKGKAFIVREQRRSRHSPRETVTVSSARAPVTRLNYKRTERLCSTYAVNIGQFENNFKVTSTNIEFLFLTRKFIY